MMNSLLKKKVNIKDPSFLQFFYPHFTITSSLDDPIDYSKGIIYTGMVSETVLKRLSLLTDGEYIIISSLCDINLENPSDYIKTFFPLLENKADAYSNYDLDDLLPLIKQYYILQKHVPLLKEEETTVYELFSSMVISSKIDSIYFSLLKEMNVNVIASSVLSFLMKVQTENFSNLSVQYRRLIHSAHLKFGNRIKSAIMQYINSDQCQELALWSLLHSLVE